MKKKLNKNNQKQHLHQQLFENYLLLAFGIMRYLSDDCPSNLPAQVFP